MPDRKPEPTPRARHKKSRSYSRAEAGIWDRLRGHSIIAAIGLFALLYLALLTRAVSLDTQVGDIEEQIAQAEAELLLAKQDLYICLTPNALGIKPGDDRAPYICGAPEVVRTPPLPEMEPSLIVAVAGGMSSEEPSLVASLDEGAPGPSDLATNTR